MNVSTRSSLRYLLSLTPGFLVIAGNLAGGYFSMMGSVYTMILMVCAEWLMKEDHQPNNIPDARIPDTILALHVLLQSASVGTLVYGIEAGVLAGPFIFFAALSVGINSGIEGINSAHEMIHRKQKAWQWAGIWNLVTVNYGHFFTEHIKNHHRNVGTAADPATARYGETLYRFVVRTVPAQLASAWHIEANRLSSAGKKRYGVSNFMVRLLLAEAGITGLFWIFFGFSTMAAFLFQSAVAIFLLEYVNYIEHYGLARVQGKKVDATVSWQSDMPVSRFALIELSRHSDHHMTASKPYHTLESHAESPVLPGGYFGSFYWALIPWLWFRKIHPVLSEYEQKRREPAVV